MLAFFDPDQFKHEPKFSLFSGVPKPNSEVAERAKVLRDALLQHGHELKIPKPHGITPVEAVHHQDYLHFLKNIYRRWQEIPGASAEVIPNIHPNRTAGSEPCGIPESAVGQADGTWQILLVLLAMKHGILHWQVLTRLLEPHKLCWTDITQHMRYAVRQVIMLLQIWLEDFVF